MSQINNNESIICTECRREFDAALRICPNCHPEISPADDKFKLPIIFYPVLFLFAIYFIWHFLNWLFVGS